MERRIPREASSPIPALGKELSSKELLPPRVTWVALVVVQGLLSQILLKKSATWGVSIETSAPQIRALQIFGAVLFVAATRSKDIGTFWPFLIAALAGFLFSFPTKEFTSRF